MQTELSLPFFWQFKMNFLVFSQIEFLSYKSGSFLNFTIELIIHLFKYADP
jgi:hypothetical protein